MNRKFMLLLLCLLFFSQTTFAEESKDLKAEICSKLECCKCGVQFNKCECAEAREIKAYIDALIESGVAKDEIFYKVAKKFSPSVIADRQIKEHVEKRLIQEIDAKHALLVVEPASFDFGIVSKKQGKVRKTFQIYNNGSSPLVISNVKTSCACVTASLIVGENKSPYFGTGGAPDNWSISIQPNEVAGLEFVLDLHHRSVVIGPLIREVTIFSNDPIYPKLFIRVEAKVTQ